MSRILLLGASPLPGEGDARLMAPGLRTWQLATALGRAGHAVRAVCLRDPRAAPLPPRLPEAEALGVELIHLHEARFLDRRSLAELAHEQRPDAVVNAGSWHPARAAVEVAGERPLWLDLPGDLMAEAQLRAAAAGDEAWLARYWEMLQPCLDRGDRFSVVSERQRWALWGELMLRGRATSEQVGAELVHVVEPATFAPGGAPGPGPRARGVVPRDAFVVCASGGYNTWFDDETLAEGLRRAMADAPDSWFVSAGGAVEGHDDATYARLQAALGGTGRARFLGRLDGPALEGLYAEAEVAVMCDRPSLETWLGSRNRILDWRRAGSTVVATRGCELVERLAPELEIIPPRDPRALAERLLELRARRPLPRHPRVDPPDELPALRAWAQAPSRAPGGPPVALEALRARVLEARASELQAELERVYNSPTLRALSALGPPVRTLAALRRRLSRLLP